MKNALTLGAALLLSTSIAHAGGLDRSGQGIGIIFEEGNVAQLSFGYVSPEVSGEVVSPVLGAAAGLESGNMAPAYTQFSAGVKYAVSDDIDVAIILDQPYGALVDYSDASTGYYTGAVDVDVTATAITALGRYKIDENMSVHGGLRVQTVQAMVAKPNPIDYLIESEKSTAVGFVVGAAYEIPAIALRVALTYNSKISHDIKATETCLATGVEVAAGVFADIPCDDAPATSSLDTPESINLDFQTGIAEDTLLFGSVRYAKWTQFDYAPAQHVAFLGGSLQSYDEDTVAYNIGVGRRFSDTFSGAISVGYEAEQGGFAGDLAPTDGNLSFGLGGTYTAADYEITAGVRYIMLGDADTANPFFNPLAPDLSGGAVATEFRDNTATAFGVQISRSF
jgi:long-subunit fatty acid transport protein